MVFRSTIRKNIYTTIKLNNVLPKHISVSPTYKTRFDFNNRIRKKHTY